jgi:hypothetical protein
MFGLERMDKKFQIGIIVVAIIVLAVVGISSIPKSANSANSSAKGISVFCLNPDCNYEDSFSSKDLWKIMQNTNNELQYAEQVPPFSLALTMGWGSSDGPLLCPKCNEATLIIKQDTSDKTVLDEMAD